MKMALKKLWPLFRYFRNVTVFSLYSDSFIINYFTLTLCKVVNVYGIADHIIRASHV